jgi:threonine dehydrogenase-like Zn-dependent dehydrogenase
MRAVILQGNGEVRVEDRPRPHPVEPTDAVLRVTTAAICGTDLHLAHGKVPGAEPGMTLGHEFVGVVEEVGPAVRNVIPGGRYVASMATACGGCRPCSRHDHRNCGDFALFGLGDGFGSLEGGQAEYVRVPLADMTLAALPDDVSDEQAVLLSDILPTAHTAVLQAGVRPGDSVAVVGAGPVGQLAVMCAHLVGAAPVFAIDLAQGRLEEAEALGAIPIDASAGDPSDMVAEHTGMLGADVVIEAVGSQSSLETAWSVARTGGTIAIVGALIEEEWPISCGDSWLRGLTVVPILGDSLTHRWDLLQLLRSGRLHPERIISHTMALDDAVEAYRLFERRGATKVLLQPAQATRT